MRRLRNIVIAVVLLVGILAMTGCTTYDSFKAAFFGEKGQQADVVRIGVLEPQTGNDSKMGQEEIKGIELAHKLVPSVLGKNIELIYEDTQSSIYVTENAVEDLIAKEPAVVLGSYGDTVTLIASQLLGEAKLPAIAITPTNPLITTNNPYYFRVSFTDGSQGKALAHYVVEKLKLKKAAVIRMAGDDTSTELISKFKGRMRRLTENQDSVSLTVDLEKDVNDYTDYLMELKAAKIKAVFMPVDLTQAEKVFATASELRMTGIRFIGPQAWHGDELLEIAKKYPDINISVASDMVSHKEEAEAEDAKTTSLYDQFVKAYEEEYLGAEPTEAAALAFDAYMIAVNAIKTAGSTESEILRDTMLKETDLKGASGQITFDEVGEPKKPVNVDIIKDGKYVSVFTKK